MVANYEQYYYILLSGSFLVCRDLIDEWNAMQSCTAKQINVTINRQISIILGVHYNRLIKSLNKQVSN